MSIAAAQLSDQGLYEVIYMDGSEELGRAQAQLTVIQQFFAPEISTHPSDKVATVKTQVVFSVEASGSNLSYQWLKNGSEISGANLSSLTIASAETSDAGDYSVRVSNSAGELESQSANLTVELRKVVVDCVHNYSYAYCKKPDGSCFTTYCGPGWDNATCGIAPQYGVPQSQVKKIASQKYKRSMCGSPSKSYQAQYEVSF